MKISVSMITLNERDYIESALRSCSFADEIVVNDGGSTDGTLDILEKWGVKIIKTPWENHFGKQRQISLENCTGDWIVRIDADEVFSEEFEKNIKKVLSQTKYNALTIRQCNLIGDISHYSKIADNHESFPRIFKRLPEVKWSGHIHERLDGIKGKIEIWDTYVVHYGFLNKERYFKKGVFYSKIPNSGFDSPEKLVYRDYDIQPRPERSKEKEELYLSLKEKYKINKGATPEVAIIRGPNLNKWEMQNYEPLKKRYELTAYSTLKHNFDHSKISIPIVNLPTDPNSPIYLVGLESELFNKDLIFTADITWLFSYQAAMAKKKFGNKLVVLEWENIPFIYENDKNIREIKKTVRENADAFIAVTQRAKEALVLEGVDEKKIAVIPPGVDADHFMPQTDARLEGRKEFNLDEKDIVILFAGRLVWEKGIYDYIHAAKMVVSDPQMKNRSIKFIIIGKGPEEEGIRARAKELGIYDRFLFINSVPYHDMPKFFNMSDIFVLPSIPTKTWQEQLGMVLIESMACGLPVISAYSGSIPEVVGDSGILVQPNDPHSLAEGMKKLVKDENLRKKYSLMGREKVLKNYNSKNISSKIGEIFERLIDMKEFEKREISGEAKHQNQDDNRSYYQCERQELAILISEGSKRILDIGCGEGLLGRSLLEKRGVEMVVGVENDPEVAQRAKENLSEVICGDIERIELPFTEGFFDCIICGDVLEHLVNPKKTLERLKSYLRDGGELIASIPNVRNYRIINNLAEGRWKYEEYGIMDKNHLRFFTMQEIKELCAEAGFKIKEIKANLDPLYSKINNPQAGEIKFGRVSLTNLNQEEIKDLFVIQYLIKAKLESKECKGYAPSKISQDNFSSTVSSEIIQSDSKIIDENLITAPEPLESIRLAEEQIKQNNFEEALVILKECENDQTLNEDDKFKVNCNIGECLTNLGNTEEAINYFQMAEKLKPDSEKPYIGFGVIAIIQSDYKKAKNEFERATELSYNNEKAHLGLGISLWNQGMKEQGFKRYIKSLDINNENLQALNLLVRSAYELNKFEVAEKYLLKYLDIHPGDLNILFSLAGVCVKQNKYKEAEEEIEKILIFDQEYKGANELLEKIRLNISGNSQFFQPEISIAS